MKHHRLPDKRFGVTRKFSCGAEVYLTVNAFPDGEPSEIFVKVAKQGSTLSGLMQAWAITVSAALQREIPWSVLREKYLGMTFDPRTDEYSSLVDAVAKNVDEMISELRRQYAGGTLQMDQLDQEVPDEES